MVKIIGKEKAKKAGKKAVIPITSLLMMSESLMHVSSQDMARIIAVTALFSFIAFTQTYKNENFYGKYSDNHNNIAGKIDEKASNLRDRHKQ